MTAGRRAAARAAPTAGTPATRVGAGLFPAVIGAALRGKMSLPLLGVEGRGWKPLPQK